MHCGLPMTGVCIYCWLTEIIGLLGIKNNPSRVEQLIIIIIIIQFNTYFFAC
jgi:hypothetical protein